MSITQIERDIELEQAMHHALSKWLQQGHTNGILSDIGYDPIKFPYQRIDVHHVEPNEPSIEYIKRFGAIAMGGSDKFERFVDFLKEIPGNPVNTAIDRARNGQNSLVAGLHLDDVFDIPIIEAGFYCASGDDDSAQYNDIWVNELLARVGIYDMPVVEGLLTKMGQVTIGLAYSETGAKAGITEEMIAKSSKPMIRGIINSTGRVVFSAPTQSTAKLTPEGYTLKEVNPIIKKILSRYIGGYACGVVLKNHGTQAKPDYIWSSTEPSSISDIIHVDELVADMADLASDLTGIKVIYSNTKLPS